MIGTNDKTIPLLVLRDAINDARNEIIQGDPIGLCRMNTKRIMGLMVFFDTVADARRQKRQDHTVRQLAFACAEAVKLYTLQKAPEAVSGMYVLVSVLGKRLKGFDDLYADYRGGRFQ